MDPEDGGCCAAVASIQDIHHAHGTAVFGTGAHRVTLGMHLIFSADNTGSNGPSSQAALDIARSQQDVRDLLQAQGNDLLSKPSTNPKKTNCSKTLFCTCVP